MNYVRELAGPPASRPMPSHKVADRQRSCQTFDASQGPIQPFRHTFRVPRRLLTTRFGGVGEFRRGEGQACEQSFARCSPGVCCTHNGMNNDNNNNEVTITIICN